MFSLSSANEAILKLLQGEIPQPIPLDDSDKDDDTRRLLETVNSLIGCLSDTRDFLISLSEGRLDVVPPKRNFLISPFKHLQANLRHLVWQTQQVARGDFNQRVDFLGEFSVAFNSMIDSLREKLLVEKALEKSHEALRASEETFSKSFFLSPDAVSISLLIDGMFVSVNKGFKQIFGYQEEEIIGKTSLELNMWDNPEDWNRLVEELKAEGIVVNFEAHFRTKNGDIRIGLLSASIIELNGAPHILNITRDITDYKRLERERIEMERKAHAHKLESLAVMAGGIAHDFNNQLAVVLGNLELALMDRALDPETRLSIEKAVTSAKQSAELARQMQIYAGRTFYYPVDLDLNEFLNRNPSLLKLCVSSAVTLNLRIYDKLPMIKGDADQIQRLIVNIMVNASEAIGDNAGDVILTTGVIDCDEAYLSRSRLEKKPEPGRFVFLEVTDTGCGMDIDTQHRLFDPFFSTKFTGRGLGLAEVMGIVKGHRGAIIVESEPGKGTIIRVLFPVQ
ncbi:MAG: PAS domain S-box protein [Desulfomonilaceae bacterium]